MTISSTTRKAGPFTGNGTTTAFPFAFKVFQASDVLVVRLNVATNVESTLVLNTDYTITLNLDQDSNPGGTITLPAALATGYKLTATSDLENLQPTDLTNQGGFYPDVINDSLDRATIQIQQIQEQTDRSLKVALSSTVNPTLPSPVANDVIGWNADGTALANIDPGSLASIVAYATAYADTFTGDGSTLDWVLTRNPGTIYNLDVSINGVTQVPNTDYTISGATFSTTTAAPINSEILVKYREALPNTSGDSQDFRYLPAGTGAVPTTVQAKLRESVSIKDFGAVGDGVVDDTAAIQAAVDYLFANNGSSLYFPDGIYYLGTPVEINFDAQNTLRLHGSATSNYFGFNTGGARITGAVGMESMFIFTKTNLAAAGGYGFECDHIFFKSGSLGTAGPLTALKNKIGGAPARPFVVANCGFIGFDKAIVSDLSGTSGLTTGICQVTVRESTFVSCNYALYGTGGLGNIMDLLFTGNAAENGGKIYIDTTGGTCNISDNLLEGQPDAIYITAGLATISIKRNYFEANTGYLMYVRATNPASSVTEADNYITNCAGAKVYFQNLKVNTSTDWRKRGVLFDAPSATANSVFSNEGAVVPASWSNFNYRFSLNSISKQTSVPPGTLTNGAYSTLGASSEVTPVGTVNFQTLASTFSNWMTPAAISLASGDAVVAMAIARRTSNNPNIYLAVYDNAYSPIGNSDTSQPLLESAVGEWVFIAAIVKVNASSSGAPRIRWVAASGTVDISSTYFYKVAAPTNNSTEAYFCMLNP